MTLQFVRAFGELEAFSDEQVLAIMGDKPPSIESFPVSHEELQDVSSVRRVVGARSSAPDVQVMPPFNWGDVRGDLDERLLVVDNPDPDTVNEPVVRVPLNGIGMGPAICPSYRNGWGKAKKYPNETSDDRDINPFISGQLIRLLPPVWDYFQLCAARARWQVCGLSKFEFVFTNLSEERDDPFDCFKVVSVNRVARVFATAAHGNTYVNDPRRDSKQYKRTPPPWMPLYYVVNPKWLEAIAAVWAAGELAGPLGRVIRLAGEPTDLVGRQVHPRELHMAK